MWILVHKPKGLDEWRILNSAILFDEFTAKESLALKRQRYSLLGEFKLAKIEVLEN